MNRSELSKKKIPELKEMLKTAGKPVSGNKSVLIDRLVEPDQDVINLSGAKGKGKKIKLGNLIINIHNNLGGEPNHPYVNSVAKLADRLPEEEKKYAVSQLKPHIQKAVKHPVVQTTKPIQKVAPQQISAKAQSLKNKVESELKQIKKSGGMNPAFKKSLEALFGNK
jgi:hypothetical protein